MSDRSRHTHRMPPWLFVPWLLLAVATLVLAFTGWLQRDHGLGPDAWRPYENAAFLTLRAFEFGESYDRLGESRASVGLIIARWTGLCLVLSTLVVGARALFSTQFTTIKAGLRKGHTLIVGDHEMARALASEAIQRRLKVVHISGSVTEPEEVGSLITLPGVAGGDALVLGRASVARRIIIAETDLGASIDSALRALKSLPAADAADSSKVAVHLDDPVIAERIHHAPGGANLYAFSEAQAAARAVMLRHPPFLLARRLQAPAIHVVIVGFGRLGQAVARDIILNSAVSDLGPPHITVIDTRAQAVREAFLHTHPELNERRHFLICADLDQAELAIGKPPVCAVYICLRDSAEALSSAIGYSERASRHDHIQGPIFVRLRSGGPLRPDAGVAGLEERKIYSFGALSDAAASCAAVDEDPDADAKRVHQVYADAGGYSAAPWEELSEELKVSNRRVINHVPAKLASLGFDLEPWLALPDAERHWPPRLADGESLFRNETDRRDAADLEHTRWVADRHVNGWRHGAKRDNRRKLQPYICAFDKLPKDVQAYDYAIVDWLQNYLKADGTGVVRRPKA